MGRALKDGSFAPGLRIKEAGSPLISPILPSNSVTYVSRILPREAFVLVLILPSLFNNCTVCIFSNIGAKFFHSNDLIRSLPNSAFFVPDTTYNLRFGFREQLKFLQLLKHLKTY